MAYMIYEREQLMDGWLFHTKEALFAAIPHADADARIFAFDMAEAFRDGVTAMRDVTEDMVHEAYRAGHVFMEACWHKLPGRFIDPMETADDVAERQRDAMLAEVA